MEKKNNKVMVLGYGSAGQYVLDFITRMEELRNCEIIVASRTKAEDMIARINTTLVSAGLMNFYPKVRYVECDIKNTEQLNAVLSAEKPDIIAYTGRYIKGVKYGAYSYPNELGYGVWLPLSLPLIYRVMKSVKLCCPNAKVINTSFPDGVCFALASVGLAPFTGAGNLNHLIPRVKMAYSNAMNLVDTDDIEIKMVGAHYLNTYVSKEGNPKGSLYKLMVAIKSGMFEEVGEEEALKVFEQCKIPMESGHIRNLMISADVAQIIRQLNMSKETLIHLPGYMGMPGGYPVQLSATTDRIDLTGPEIVEAVKINKQSLACDGIEDIRDGVITFTDDAIAKMKSVFNIKYPKTLRVEMCEEFAEDIVEALKAYEENQKLKKNKGIMPNHM